FMILSFIAIAVIYRFKLKVLKSRWIINLLIVVLVLAMIYSRIGPGTVANGAHGWIPIPGIGTVQPAEFAKFFIIWYLASVFSKKQEEIESKDVHALFKGKTLTQKIFGGWRLPLILIVLIELIMPDIGNTAIIVLLILAMVASSGISYEWYSGYSKLILAVSVGFLGLVYFTQGKILSGPFAYANKRFQAYINPFADVSNSGHQMANSYYAIANGGWLGRGLGNSIESQGFLPEAHTDFIFSIVVEEMGLIGAFIVLGILFFLMIRILRVGIKAKNAFNSLICIGVASWLLIQVFINVGGAIGVIPETGVTFPFLSQGGSSFLVSSLGIAFVLNISADEKRREIQELTYINSGVYDNVEIIE
ncbi:MAG: FtsW/RodA/SpoVE family cell cycle protein, partial [Streptococcaceae bacterium]|nr:FtsW/RodA/SpoVE family cell cycle protein [Streptococcaceae bacterium]